MVRRCSIAEAGDDLPMLVREAESGIRIELVREGRSVAAIVPLPDEDEDLGVVGNSLDHLIGCWSAEEEQEFLQAIAAEELGRGEADGNHGHPPDLRPAQEEGLAHPLE